MTPPRTGLAFLVLCHLFASVGAAEPDWEWAPATRHRGDIHTIRWSPDGSKILTGGEDGQAIVWEAKTGRKVRAFTGIDNDANGSANWSGDGSRVLTVSRSTVRCRRLA